MKFVTAAELAGILEALSYVFTHPPQALSKQQSRSVNSQLVLDKLLSHHTALKCGTTGSYRGLMDTQVFQVTWLTTWGQGALTTSLTCQ